VPVSTDEELQSPPDKYSSFLGCTIASVKSVLTEHESSITVYSDSQAVLKSHRSAKDLCILAI